jgi:hypothetical protein
VGVVAGSEAAWRTYGEPATRSVPAANRDIVDRLGPGDHTTGEGAFATVALLLPVEPRPAGETN